MYSKIAIAYRGDRHGDDALALAGVLAEPASVEQVVLVEALKDDRSRAAAERRLESLQQPWPSHVSTAISATAGGSPAEALVAAVTGHGADFLVLGSTHRGFAGRVLIGTTGDRLIREAPFPIVIAPMHFREESARLRTVGVAFDGFPESRVALGWAADLAAAFGAPLRLIGVVEPQAPPAETWAASAPADAWSYGLQLDQSTELVQILRERLERDLEAARESLGRDDTEVTTVVGGAVGALRDEAEDLDMLVVGSRGRGHVASMVMGSVSRGLAHSCPAPLAVVPSHTSNGDGEPAAS
jgi:nucleotide-binding universal stress UspA family protein